VNLPIWPFSLVRSAGFTFGSVPTHVEIQELQEKVEACADGRTHTDLALYKTWVRSEVVGSNDVVSAYDRVSRRWILQETTIADPGQWSISGNKWFSTANPSLGGPNLTASAIHANVGGQILVGGQPATSTTLKLARSVNGGDTYTRIAIGASNNNTVIGFGYTTTLGLWFAAVTAEGIFSSSDGGLTWTNRFATPYNNFIVREGFTPLFLAMRKPNVGANAEYATSTNGTAWTTRTFPVNLVSGGGVAADGPLQGVYSDRLLKFFQPTPSGIYSSPDGINWTLVDASYTNGGLAISDRVMLRGDGKASLDGTTWYPVLETASPTLGVCATPSGGACMIDNATDERFVSLQGGF
jgi:hypothetical protein